jgi:hypothetical protein
LYACAHATSWAVCGERPREAGDGAAGNGAAGDGAVEADEDEHPRADTDTYSATARTGLARAEQAALGRACKRLIDAGRLALLRDMGYEPRLLVCYSFCLNGVFILQKYVEEDFTLENIVLIATKLKGNAEI